MTPSSPKPHGVCPWWIGCLLASPIRRLFQSPAKLLAPYVREGMTVLEPGPGMGFFTIELARLVGSSGRVVAVDIQPRMLAGLRRRVEKAGMAHRVDIRLASAESMGIADLAGVIDFTLAFAMVHELPSPADFFHQVAVASKPGGRVLLVEPAGHVKAPDFEKELQLAALAGLTPAGSPSVGRSRTALLEKARRLPDSPQQISTDTLN